MPRPLSGVWLSCHGLHFGLGFALGLYFGLGFGLGLYFGLGFAGWRKPSGLSGRAWYGRGRTN